VADLAVSVAVGTIAGGLTNAVAVWMLFHPYERRWGLQGAIPKNKARLARAIGRTVGEKLLTPGDILDELSRAGLDRAVEAKLADALRAAFDVERGALRDELPPALFAEVERAIGDAGPRLAEGWDRFVRSPEFEARVHEFVGRARAELAPLTLGSVLTPALRTQLAAQAAVLATETIESGRRDDARSLRHRVGDALLRLAGTERTERFVERTVDDLLARAEARSWGEVLAPLEDATIAGWVLEAARSARAGELALGAVGGTARALLDRPLGRVGRFLPADAATRVAAVVTPALWDWLRAQLPGFLERLDIEAMVERKVLGFSTQRLEEIIRSVTQRELRLIVNLGYLLGAVIGAVSWIAVGRS
jgi:uncharacterized membrane protein YheB (UPF0754 family)